MSLGNSNTDYDLVIAGAGMVGVSAALYAQKVGLKTLICDPNPPGSGTTYGSACTIATYACVPVNSPAIFRSLPQLLFSRDSPLSFNVAHGLKNPRWMLSFLANCRARNVARISTALGAFLRETDAGLNPLISEAGAQDLVVSNDCLYVWSSRSAFEAARTSNDMRRSQGVAFEELSPSDILSLEPNLKGPLFRGLRFRGARHVTSPQELVTRMMTRFRELGGSYLPQEVMECLSDSSGVTLRLGDRAEVRGARFALTAGARAGQVRGSGAEDLPLGTERGYHVLYKKHGGQISRPVGWAEAGFYATPMAQGLRIAGTVEINAVDAPFNTRCTDYLARKSQEMFGPLGVPDETWLGHRPTMPDALPVIGPSAQSDRVIYAFGHQHIGLTLGGITGQIVTDLAQGKAPSCDISAFGAERFA